MINTLSKAAEFIAHRDAADASPFRGYCRYKSGKCMQERALKRNGEPHTLCNMHRMRQNAHQRKSDRNRRIHEAKFDPYGYETSFVGHKRTYSDVGTTSTTSFSYAPAAVRANSFYEQREPLPSIYEVISTQAKFTQHRVNPINRTHRSPVKTSLFRSCVRITMSQ